MGRAAVQSLVVDDEASVRRVSRRLLECAGHRVNEAAAPSSFLHKPFAPGELVAQVAQALTDD